MFPRISDIINYFTGSQFSWPVYTYSFFLVSAFTGAFAIVYLELKRKSNSGDILPKSEQHTLHYTLLVLICAFLGLKLFHYLDYPEQFLSDPLEAILSIGGLSFYGGLIFGTLAVIIYSMIIKVPLPHAGDIAAPAICLGYAVGRMGCHLSGDGCWGITNPEPQPGWLAFLPGSFWACNYPHNVVNEGVVINGCVQEHCRVLPDPVFPTSLYESLLSLVFFILLWLVRKRNWIPGYLFAIYLVLGGSARFFIEFIRINPKYDVAGVTLSQAQIISILAITAGLFLFWLFRSIASPAKKTKKI